MCGLISTGLGYDSYVEFCKCINDPSGFIHSSKLNSHDFLLH